MDVTKAGKTDHVVLTVVLFSGYHNAEYDNDWLVINGTLSYISSQSAVIFNCRSCLSYTLAKHPFDWILSNCVRLLFRSHVTCHISGLFQVTKEM